MDKLHSISIQYNIDKLNILKHYFNYIIRKKKAFVSREFLDIVEVILHLNETNVQHILHYFVVNLQQLYSKPVL